MSGEYTTDTETLQSWVGRTQERIEVISPGSCNQLERTLNREAVLEMGDPLPPLRHFITHLPQAKTNELDSDGHAKRGDLLPPVALPRRMWAGSRLEFLGDIELGSEVHKRSTVDKITMKDGRSGTLCFVTVKHELSVGGEQRILEEQDLVFREAPDPDAQRPTPKPAPENAQFTQTITPLEIMLFRFSALTFNSHRIHYDRAYAENVEAYDGLVVHGPLTATLLADLAVGETGQRLLRFSFRGLAPIVDGAPFTIAGNRDGDDVELWAATADGGLAMSATATLAR